MIRPFFSTRCCAGLPLWIITEAILSKEVGQVVEKFQQGEVVFCEAYTNEPNTKAPFDDTLSATSTIFSA